MIRRTWKKINEGKYINKKRNGVLYIGKSPFTGKPDVTITIDRIKIDNSYFPKTHIYEEFKTKKEAMKFAKRYMKRVSALMVKLKKVM